MLLLIIVMLLPLPLPLRMVVTTMLTTVRDG
jgi:hypothetical protein